MITFEIALPGIISTFAEVRYDNIGRSAPFPHKVLSEVRRQKAEEKAAEAARASGCPCQMAGYIGEESGDDITLATQLNFEWQHVRRFGGGATSM